jgi:hypothetical protein
MYLICKVKSVENFVIGIACLAKSAPCWFQEALCRGKQKKKQQDYLIQIVPSKVKLMFIGMKPS